MPRVIRTSVRPNKKIVHTCRDTRGKKVQREGTVGQRCTACDTHIVYVWDNTPKPKPKNRRRRYG